MWDQQIFTFIQEQKLVSGQCDATYHLELMAWIHLFVPVTVWVCVSMSLCLGEKLRKIRKVRENGGSAISEHRAVLSNYIQRPFKETWCSLSFDSILFTFFLFSFYIALHNLLFLTPFFALILWFHFHPLSPFVISLCTALSSICFSLSPPLHRFPFVLTPNRDRIQQ